MDFTYAMYSEEKYVSKMELREIYSASVADLIYEQILAYRKLFRHNLQFSNRKYYVTLNTFLYKKMLKIYTSYNFVKDNQEVIHLQLFEKLSAYNIDLKMLNFLCGEEDLLMKLFILHLCKVPKEIYIVFMQVYGKLNLLPFLLNYKKETYEYVDDLDLTYAFRLFLDDLLLYLKQKETYINENGCISIEDVYIRYPMLHAKEIQFYSVHCNRKMFYTIKQYQQYFNVSYEASRQSMEKLCHAGFYQKIKVGKKYRYIPVVEIVK